MYQDETIEKFKLYQSQAFKSSGNKIKLENVKLSKTDQKNLDEGYDQRFYSLEQAVESLKLDNSVNQRYIQDVSMNVNEKLLMFNPDGGQNQLSAMQNLLGEVEKLSKDMKSEYSYNI